MAFFENMIWLFRRDYISSGLLVPIEPSNTQKASAKWEILLFSLWMVCDATSLPKMKRKIIFLIVFPPAPPSNVMQVRIPKTHSYKRVCVQGGSPVLPAGRDTVWSGQSACLDLRVDFITAFSIIPAFRMVSKVTRITGLLSLSAISNKKLLSTSSPRFYKTWQQIICQECSVSMQRFFLYSASFSPYSEGRWSEDWSQPLRRQLKIAGGLGKKKKQN